MKEFQSKKNKVYLTADKLVLKEYSNPEAFDTEIATLKKVQGKYAPKLLGYDRNLQMALLNFTQGELLVDRFLSADSDEAVKLAEILTETILNLHEKLGETITCDENFRNFIICDNKCVRIDFEECSEGTLEDWCAKLSSFASLYQNSEQVKLAFICALAKGMNVDMQKFLSSYESELRLLAERWKLEFPDEIFVGVSNKISA